MNDFRADLVENLKRGQRVRLRGDLKIPAGDYTVAAVRSDYVKVRNRKGDVIKIRRKRLVQLVEFTRPHPEGVGVLAAVGYHVGRGGISIHQRRLILEELIHRPREQLPDAENVEDWGKAETPKRFWKMVNCLSSFADGAEGQPGMEVAVDDWRSDLKWFVEQFGREYGAVL